MSKFIVIKCLGKKKECDYTVRIRPELIMSVETTCPCEREDRKDFNSVVNTSIMGPLRTDENAAQIVERVDEALSSIVP